MAIQQNFPSSRPSLSLNFARSKKLDPRITFTRTSSATYVGEDGLIKIAPANAARFDHDPITGDSLGLLVEESRTNLLLRSEEFETRWNVLNTIVTTNTVETAAPNGSFTADKLSGSSSSSNIKRISQVLSFSVVSYTFSVYAKADDQNFLQLRTFASAGDIFCNFDLSDGTVGDNVGVTSVGIQSLENGWYRCWIVFTPSSGSSSVSLNFITSLTSPNLQNTTLTTSLYLWGAQLEEGDFPTSYIPTSGSTATRAYERAQILGSSLTSFLRQGEGSVICSGVVNGLNTGSTYQSWWTLDQNNSVNRIWLYARGGGNKNEFIGGGGSTQFSINSLSNTVANQKYKLSCAYKQNDFVFCENGTQIGTDTSGDVPNVTHFGIGSRNDTQLALNGTISNLSYYPSRLPNQQLINLTK